MNDLRPLIRFHRWRLDDKQRALAELRNREDQLLQQAAELEQEVRAEQDTARGSFEAGFGYANFARAAIARRAQLAQAVAAIKDEIAAALEDIALTFQEVKRYELAQEERVRQQRAEERQKENAMLDETAQIGFFRRRRDEESRHEAGNEAS